MQPKELKIKQSDLDDSEYDLILQKKKNATILHEDEFCLAFKEPNCAVTKVHFIVIAKNK
jgi:diadenosine tetraphosphate (Ap4A) HIT family hydrolase